jgi:hypothetical protein
MCINVVYNNVILVSRAEMKPVQSVALSQIVPNGIVLVLVVVHSQLAPIPKYFHNHVCNRAQRP